MSTQLLGRTNKTDVMQTTFNRDNSISHGIEQEIGRKEYSGALVIQTDFQYIYIHEYTFFIEPG
jgi:hypothetical protein